MNAPCALLEYEDAPDMAVAPEVVRPVGFTPRGYQVTCHENIEAAWAEELKRLLVVMATGTGKTCLFSMVADRVVATGGRVLILAHTDELITQAVEKLHMVSSIRAGIEKAERRGSRHDSVVVSSIQTLSRPIRLLGWAKDHFSLIIFDEAHRAASASWGKILAHFSNANFIGVTATPDRGDEKSLGEIFQKCVFDYGLIEAVRDGYLVRPVAQTIPLNVDMRGVKLKKGADGSDLDPAEVARRLDPFLEEIATKLILHAGNRKTLIYLPSVDTAIALAKKMQSRGVSADFVSGDRERCPDRLFRMERFRQGGIQFLANCSLLIEGFDDPSISCIAPLRATRIRSLLAQMFGRATRPLPGLVDGLATADERRAAIAASAKPDALLLDFLFLTDRLDLARPAHVIASKPEVAKEMLKQPNGDLLDAEEQAERDLLLSLATEAARHKKKTGRLFDPLAVAISAGEESLRDYKPEQAWEAMPVTDDQAQRLRALGGDPDKCPDSGAAARVLTSLTRRRDAGLCTPKQMLFLKKMGIDSTYLTFKDAKSRIISIIHGNRARRTFGMKQQPINQHSI